MSEPRDQFMFFRSYYDAVSFLPDEDKAAVILAIAGYALYGIEPELEGVPAAIFTLVRPTLDVSRAKSEAGKASGVSRSRNSSKRTKLEHNSNTKRTEAEQKPNTSLTYCEQNANYKDKDKDKDKDKELSKEKESKKKSSTPSRFTPPTIDEIRAYCVERGNDVDPERFFDFYASKGWRVGQNPMKDWRAAVRTWERRDDYRGGSAVPFPVRQDNRNDNPFLQMLREEEML